MSERRASTKPATSYREFRGSPAEAYEQTFVPAIALPVSETLLDMADLREGERVIDVACGTGIVARLAAARVGASGAVVGVDLAPEMIEVARQMSAPAAASIEWHAADAVSLPLPDDSFDVALCQMGLMFVSDKPAALAQMRRVLVDAGRCVVSTPGAIQPPLEVLDGALARQVDPNLGGFVRMVFSMHEPAALEHLLDDAGFRDVRVRTTTATLRLPPPAEFLWEYVASTPLSAFVATASEDARDALEAEIVERSKPFLDDEGHLHVEQPMVFATART